MNENNVQKHTPGPWHVQEAVTITANGSIPRFLVWPDDNIETTVAEICEIDCEIEDSTCDIDEAKANAFLIASAPDLLAERDRLKDEVARLKDDVKFYLGASILPSERPARERDIRGIRVITEERDRLRASNAELLAACKILASLNDETIEECTDHFGKTGSAVTVYQFNSVQYDTLVEAFNKASAAIENATKEQK